MCSLFRRAIHTINNNKNSFEIFYTSIYTVLIVLPWQYFITYAKFLFAVIWPLWQPFIFLTYWIQLRISSIWNIRYYMISFQLFKFYQLLRMTYWLPSWHHLSQILILWQIGQFFDFCDYKLLPISIKLQDFLLSFLYIIQEHYLLFSRLLFDIVMQSLVSPLLLTYILFSDFSTRIFLSLFWILLLLLFSK